MSLIDAKTGLEAVVSFEGLTVQDLTDFCRYFEVSFYSMTAGVKEDTGLFRVGTNEFPSRGRDVSLKSVVSWLQARGERYKRYRPGDVVQYKGRELTVVGLAENLSAGELKGTSVVLSEAGELRVVSLADFSGYTFDRQRQSYVANAVEKVAVRLVA